MRPCACIALVSAAAALWGCGEENHTYVANVGDASKVPTMSTANVRTLISDSGFTRYNIETPLWDIYDNTADAYWKFPQGLELQQYDDNMHPQASMRCDSATYFASKRLWRLDGHVVMVNTLKDTMLTQQVFWNQLRQEIYSDSFVHIVRQSHVIEGYGFASNQTMTRYNVRRPTAIIPLDENRTPGTAAQPGPAADGAQTVNAEDDVHDVRRRAPIPASRRNAMISTPEQ